MEPPKKLITRILESAFMFALSSFLIKTGAEWIMDVWQILAVITIVIVILILAYRIWKRKKDDGQW